MSARKIVLLLLILGFGAVVETAWHVRGDWHIGPEGCRVMGGRFYGPSWSFEETAERTLAATAPRVEIRNAFGGVRVTAGATGVVRVKLRKVVYLPTEEKARAFAERIELHLSGEGSPLRVGTNREDVGRGEDVGFETHLEIEAPAETVVEVRNEHGRVDLSGLAGADVVSSFDGVAIERLAGALKLEARHGDVRVSDIGAGLELSARHGGVTVEGVAGPTKLDVEYGDVSARRTAALEASVKHGGYEAELVGGDLTVRAQHSEVRASDVVGRAEVETTYGGIHVARVGGQVRATARHGEITAEDVGGDVYAKTSNAGVTLDRVEGRAEVVTERGGVEASGLAKGASVRASGGDVTLDGFAGPVDVEIDRGSARLAPRAPVVDAVTVSVGNGEVRLEVPEGSRFSLEAESRRGEVRAEVPGLGASGEERRRGESLAGTLAGGGAAVRLRADGDVSLEAKPAAAIADRPVAAPKPASAPPAPATTPATPAEAPETR